MAAKDFWTTSSRDFQKHIQIVLESNEPPVPFPLILEPSTNSVSLPDVLEGVKREFAPKPGETLQSNQIRKLLDGNGGAIYLKSLPLRSVEDFSQFLDALSGDGDKGWYPYDAVAMNVLRKVQAKNVLTVNEGPPSHVIMWHSEFSISPSHPPYVVFFCLKPPESGGKTGISSSLAVYDRLKTACPRLLKACVDNGLSYPAPHYISETDTTFFGNGLYKKTAYGPEDGSDISALSEKEKRRVVDGRIRDLAEMGGWSTETKDDPSLPVWQRKGFTWKWRPDGVDVTQRVPGVRTHPTRGKETLFTALGSRYINSKNRQTFSPPHTYLNENNEEAVYLPPMYAGLPKDEPIPEEDMDILHNLQQELSVNVDWEIGDVLIIDNFAVQHSRLPWTGDRKIMASFWDQDGLKANAVSSLNL